MSGALGNNRTILDVSTRAGSSYWTGNGMCYLFLFFWAGIIHI